MAPHKSYSVLALALLWVLIVPGIIGGAQASPAVDLGRSVSIPINVILVGFDRRELDTASLSWSGSGKNLPFSITNSVLDSGNSTGVIFYPKYTISLAPTIFKDRFVSYLQSIAKSVHDKNPWFGEYQVDRQNPDYYNSVPVAIDYVVYNASLVEEWLWNHLREIGGSPENGWTIILANLPELPSIDFSDIEAFLNTNGWTLPKSKPHYYGISPSDEDLGYALRYRDFMNAWGGHHRMWFVDLSAGPVFNSQWEDLPLQAALDDNNIDLSTDFGRNWLTGYLADYISQATYNFIAPNFVYYPQYSPKYQVEVLVLDDRNSTDKKDIAIKETVNRDTIVAALRDLVPYSTVEVNVHFLDVSQELNELIKAHYKYTDSWIEGSIFISPQRYGVIDVRPIYKYVLDNPTKFESDHPSSENTVTIPVYAFAFSNQTYFTYTYKWLIGKVDYETGALLGITLNDAIMISLNQWEFTRGEHIAPAQPGKGEGFTSTIIHEVGHAFGLMHPHQYGNIGDFIFSPMGYFTNDYKFGQIDKDALQRAHVDQIYIETERLLGQMETHFDPSGLSSQARSKLAEVDSAYAKMEYADALPLVLAAYKLAKQAVETTAPVIMIYAVGGAAVGLALVVLAVAVMRRVPSIKGTAKTQPYVRGPVLCSSCGREIRPQTTFCRHCGARQAPSHQSN
jgi:hypothetical protein